MEIKWEIWAMANNNKTNISSMEPNNNSMDSSKITKIMVNMVLNNNQVITLVDLTIIKIISEHNSSNSLGSITIKIINSSNNSKDLITSNSNSPLSNKTATKVRHLICFECPIDLFNLKTKITKNRKVYDFCFFI